MELARPISGLLPPAVVETLPGPTVAGWGGQLGRGFLPSDVPEPPPNWHSLTFTPFHHNAKKVNEVGGEVWLQGRMSRQAEVPAPSPAQVG